MDTSPRNFKTGLDLLDGLVSLEPGARAAVGLISPPGVGATSLLVQIARAAGKVGPTLVFCPVPLMAGERLRFRFNSYGVTVCDVPDIEALKETVRAAKPVAVIIDGLYAYPAPEDWKGTRGEYLDLLNREMVQLAFQQRFALFLSKRVSRDPLAGESVDAAMEEGCTDLMVLTYDNDAGEHRLKLVKSRAGSSSQSQRVVLDQATHTFSALA